MPRTATALLSAGLILAASLAAAAPPQSVDDACGAEVAWACPSSGPHALHRCIRAHRDTFSAACRAALRANPRAIRSFTTVGRRSG